MTCARAVLAGLLSMLACAAGAPSVLGSSTALTNAMIASGIRPLGRVDLQDPAGPRFAWSATGAAVRFRGSQLTARLKGGGGDALQVIVDGIPFSTIALRPDTQLYTVAAGLPDTEHVVELVKRTEARVGEVQLLGFVEPLLDAPPARARRIEVIGDSISAGYGNEGPSQACRFTPGTENAFLTYGFIAARALDADVSIVAWSGRTTHDMDALYDRALPLRPNSVWDPHAFVPDAVVINLGTNDVTRDDTQAHFGTALLQLVERVRALYPQALIVCCVGSMLTDTYPSGKQTLTRARAYVHWAVDQRNHVGDSRVTYLEFPTQDPRTGYGCDYHPNVRTHQLMADRLIAHLQTELRW